MRPDGRIGGERTGRLSENLFFDFQALCPLFQFADFLPLPLALRLLPCQQTPSLVQLLLEIAALVCFRLTAPK